MLKKLLKYEFKATARYFVPMIVALLVVAAVARLSFTIDLQMSSLPIVLLMTLYAAIIISICVLTLAITIKRFYNSLLTDEGYLMMTLPVTVDKHICSKTLTAAFWLIVVTLAAVLSVIIMFMTSDVWADMLSGINEIYNTAVQQSGAHAFVWLGLLLVIGLADIFQKLTTVYMCITIGHQVPKHQVFAGIGAFIAWLIIVSIAGNLGGMLFTKTGIADWFYSLNPVPAAYLIVFGMLLLEAVTLAITYTVTRLLLSRRLNLE